mmetsp:Transcript_3338/g.9591  ORF Transcript_3338/g.9591 Transcript_3338/m.9591 type:complete len:221 (+) Transcript_3338:1593-2255(+)
MYTDSGFQLLMEKMTTRAALIRPNTRASQGTWRRRHITTWFDFSTACIVTGLQSLVGKNMVLQLMMLSRPMEKVRGTFLPRNPSLHMLLHWSPSHCVTPAGQQPRSMREWNLGAEAFCQATCAWKAVTMAVVIPMRRMTRLCASTRKSVVFVNTSDEAAAVQWPMTSCEGAGDLQSFSGLVALRQRMLRFNCSERAIVCSIMSSITENPNTCLLKEGSLQ